MCLFGNIIVMIVATELDRHSSKKKIDPFTEHKCYLDNKIFTRPSLGRAHVDCIALLFLK